MSPGTDLPIGSFTTDPSNCANDGVNVSSEYGGSLNLGYSIYECTNATGGLDPEGTGQPGQTCGFNANSECASGQCSLTWYAGSTDQANHWYCVDENGELPALPNDAPPGTDEILVDGPGISQQPVYVDPSTGLYYNDSYCEDDTQCNSGDCSIPTGGSTNECVETNPQINQIANENWWTKLVNFFLGIFVR
jgi:hypothetical protein